MQRRDFLKSAILGAGAMAMVPTISSANLLKPKKGEREPNGPVTLYFEFRILPKFKDELLKEIEEHRRKLLDTRGFLSLSLKNMVGDSTMVKNFPSNLKGVLKSAYFDAYKQETMPLFYSLFIRFENYKDLKKSRLEERFAKLMHKFGPLSKNYHAGVYKTVSAGDREHIYKSHSEIAKFLREQKDTPLAELITVNNHVAIFSKDKEEFNKKSTALLKVAQDTFRPAKGDYDYNPKFPHGMPGSFQNSHYRKAVTTEILQSAFSDSDGMTYYLFHGTWESVYDHENSHIDIRFRTAVMELFPYIVQGPNEPFYKTDILINRG